MNEDLMNYPDSLSPEELSYGHMVFKNWFTPRSGFDVNDQDLLNYFARLDQRSTPRAFIEDNSIGLAGSLGWSVHPLVGAAGTLAGMAEDATNAKRDYLWNLYKDLSNNGTRRITQDEYEKAYRASRDKELAAKDAVISGASDLLNLVTKPATKSLPVIPFLKDVGKKLTKTMATEIASEAVQQATTRYDNEQSS